MSKRIFDIIPPGEIENTQNEFEGDFDLNKTKIKEIPNNFTKKNKKFPQAIRWISLVIVIGIIGFAILIPAKAEVKIFPKTEDVQISEIIIVDSSIQELILENKIIPGKVFLDIKSFSDTYNSTGNDETSKKATATIRVYNKYSSAEPLTLKSGTHFLSNPKGLSYHSLAPINIPAPKISGSKIEPGYVDIKIEADESGEEYNISSATFSVPKLNGTPYYSTTWAETQTAISGGSSSSVKIVLEKDIDLAKESFETKYFTEALNLFKNTIPSDYEIFDENVSQELNNLNVSAKENDIATSFEVKGDVTTSALSYKNTDLKSLGEQLILISTDSAVKQIVPNSIFCKIENSKQDFKNNKLELSVTCTAKTYWLPDNDFLYQTLSGKNKDSSASLLKSLSDVKNAEVKIWPFWKNNMPIESKNIDIKLSFE